MNQSPESAPGKMRPAASLLLEDLELLCDGPLVDLHLACDGGLIAVRSNEALIFHEAAEALWMRSDASGRARLLCSWLHNAARKVRARHARALRTTGEVA
jgi:hypothetical protein